jgi:hypothetical protein
MPARHPDLRTICFPEAIHPGGSGWRKRVSARHQVKRLDRLSKKGSLFEVGPAEETGFFVRCGPPFGSAISPGPKPIVKSDPDVFADALVPMPAIWCRLFLFPDLSCKTSGSLRPHHGRRQCCRVPPAFAHDGYRSANRHGKPDFKIADKPLCCRHFSDCGNRPRQARLHAVHRDT